MQYLIGEALGIVLSMVIVFVIGRKPRGINRMESEMLEYWRKSQDSAMDRNILLGRIAASLEDAVSWVHIDVINVPTRIQTFSKVVA